MIINLGEDSDSESDNSDTDDYADNEFGENELSGICEISEDATTSRTYLNL
jgi:hypothetical protein